MNTLKNLPKIFWMVGLIAIMMLAAFFILPGNSTTVSSQSGFTLEKDTDRRGGDYKDFDLREANHELCRDACAAESTCKAYTYVHPWQGSKPHCWLKSSVPNPESGLTCCISGVKSTGNACRCKDRCPDCEGLPSLLCEVEGESEKAKACRRCMSDCRDK